MYSRIEAKPKLSLKSPLKARNGTKNKKEIVKTTLEMTLIPNEKTKSFTKDQTKSKTK